MGKDCYVVDVHTHPYRTARQGWQGRALEDRYSEGGTIEELTRYMEEAEVDQAWLLFGSPNLGWREAARRRVPKNLTPIQLEETNRRIEGDILDRIQRMNTWLCSVAKSAPDRFKAFIGGIDPTASDKWMVHEIEEKFRQGATGVKLAPGYSSIFRPSDRTLWPAYRKLEELGMVLFSHSGESFSVLVGQDPCALPGQFADVAAEFPKLKILLAHCYWPYGGCHHGPKQVLQLANRYPNVYFDIAGCFEEGLRADDERFIREIGVDRVMFGSDWHAHRAMMGLEALKRSGFDENEKRKILGGNARRFLDLKL